MSSTAPTITDVETVDVADAAAQAVKGAAG
jgi:hypothetical protein